jgi:DNA-3-methyladenine glycosylase II
VERPAIDVAHETPIPVFPVGPLDLRHALAYLRTSPSAVLEEIGDDTYVRPLTLRGQDLLLTVRPAMEQSALLMTVEGDDIDADVLSLAQDRVRAVFSLDADPAPFLAVTQSDPIFVRVRDRFAGLRPVLIADPFEALIWAIIGQQINVAFARKLKARLVELVGRRLRVRERDYLLFPSPAEIAGLDAEILRANQFSRQKAAYVLTAAEAVASGDLVIDALAALPYEDAIAALVHYKGIGRWTAEYLLMRGLGAADSIPAADLGLRAIIGKAYGLDRTATESEVRQIAAGWAPYRGWASFYWWMALQNGGI